MRSRANEDGNGDGADVEATPAKLEKILGKANSEKTEQEAFWRTHDAREEARQRIVRKREGRQ